jgi:hypothetical protein
MQQRLHDTLTSLYGLFGSASSIRALYSASPLRAVEDELGVRGLGCVGVPLGFSADGDAERFRRRGQAELKHGGIHVLATMGYIALEITGKFPGYVSTSLGSMFPYSVVHLLTSAIPGTCGPRWATNW